MVRNFCYLCGGKLIKQEGEGWQCEQCGFRVYANPKPSIDAVLFNDADEVLLTVRNREPRKGFLNLPGGFLDINETLEAGMARELEEELGATAVDYDQLVFATSYVIPYETKYEVQPLICSIFTARVKRTDFVAQDDVESFVWIKIADIDPSKMAQGEKELDVIKKAASKLNVSY